MDLERIREAAERVARSEGVEVVDVEWKVGKQRFLRVYIDRPPGPTSQIPAGAAVSGISHRDCERVSEQLSVILDVEDHAQLLADPLDRKSTRLNSSQRSISYAVSRLEKKQNNRS